MVATSEGRLSFDRQPMARMGVMVLARDDGGVPQDRVDRLEASYATFRDEQPDVAQALDALGLSIEDYERGLEGYSAWPRTYLSTVASTPEAGDEEPTAS